MPICQPGHRLTRAFPLKFVQRRVCTARARPTHASLSLTSMIDFLLVTVVFLLTAFDAPARCAGKRVTVPAAENGLDAIDAPMVSVAGSQVLVDGYPAGSTRFIEETNRVQRMDEVFAVLKAKRDTWVQLNPGKTFPGAVALVLDQDTRAVVLKSVFQTAANAGYPNVSFVVSQLPRRR